MEIEKPYLLFLGGAPDDLAAKTAHDPIRTGVSPVLDELDGRFRA